MDSQLIKIMNGWVAIANSNLDTLSNDRNLCCVFDFQHDKIGVY